MGLQYYQWIKSAFFGIGFDRYNWFREDWSFIAVCDWDCLAQEYIDDIDCGDIESYQAFEKLIEGQKKGSIYIGIGKTPSIAMAKLEEILIKQHIEISRIT